MVNFSAVFGSLSLILLASGRAALSLASPFTDHMVLQQEMPVPVWGWSTPGAAVEVMFDGQQLKTTATAEGAWRVVLEPLEGSYEAESLKVSSAGETVTLEDVVVGEVWICSGQSNMQFSYRQVDELKALAEKAAAGSAIRSFEVERTVALAEQDRCEGKWKVSIPDSAVGFGFAYHLQQRAKVPVGVIVSCWGSSSIEAWMPRDMVESVPHFKTLMEEFDADEETHEKLRAALSRGKNRTRAEDIFMRRQPNILYNAMMKPLAPFACRGVVWYQGERNTQSMFGMVKTPWFARNSGMLKYEDTLKEWIQRYRKEWERDDMEFLLVMLPRYFKGLPTGPKQGAGHPETHSWAWMRESQLGALALPDVAVVNTIDLGDAKNVHPKDKAPIGERLALLAARDVLGQNVIAEGPVFTMADVEQESIVVYFDHAGGLK
ncbi:MAG: sialate O-acetylesterase, partial [Verrucomicrobiales bacterium]